MKKEKTKNYIIKPMSGGEAAAEALRQIGIEVMASYPITPQSPIIETFSKMVADGRVNAETINVESEHSAMSACVGSAVAGAKTATASNSQGLALMSEIVYVASGLRLPILMAITNRALSAPISIHCDHSDSMMVRDSGWIQIYTENAQEFYEFLILAFKIASRKEISLPIMVMTDGFISTHQLEKVAIFDDKAIADFIGEYNAPYDFLNPQKPILVGPFSVQDSHFEFKLSQQKAIERVPAIFKEEAKNFKKITGKDYKFFEEYRLKDANTAIVVMNSTAGTAKEVVDKLRDKGEKVGLLKPHLFRSFPYKEIAEALKKVKKIAVLDRSMSFGANPPLFAEINQSLAGTRIPIQKYVFGLGGRAIFERQIEQVFADLKKGKIDDKIKYIQ